ncbi:chorismate lyase [Acinetobacter sp. ANC 5579]|uniref:chorismate--pyruvate lyase family protein n=1 Tax=Acinetobacter TaxID=469 RepID=UPI000DD0BAA3|nr:MULTISPECIES: chorismate lyase [Acinetobacter]MCL6235070.1 chorismate lyase [Acinetobacter amyesii]MCL6240685.1 chorismate lyase [Acinetobacter amyesii]QOW49304.1 chorismate lyase [Acinetobacter sp. YH12138]UUS58691.1 chorismate lyase [Acinetobacter sp. YH16040_T]UUS66201.1 chorismate lyase [Acinetobacter sp. YH12068_T]
MQRQACEMRDKRMSPELRTWLYASGSLTQQLTDFAQGVFKVEPSIEQFQRMTLQDARWLQMPIQHTAWVRESYLYGCEAEPWVKAKSIFPILSIQGRARIFQHIGKKPIGHFLFQRTNPKCERRVLWLDDGWTRQSCYTWHGCKFIVQETFLASFEQYLQK